jgi:hypothetical protein
MIKKLLFVFALFTVCNISAQNKINISEPCGSDVMNQKLMDLNPEIVEKMILFEKKYNKKTQTAKTTSQVYVIPIVVHVMHKG